MLVSVDKKHEEFLTQALKELSKYDDKDVKCFMFAALVGNDVMFVFEDCDCMDKAFFATQLQMAANYEYTFENMLELKKNIESHDDNESEDN